jgi:hypothetical protein
MGKQTLMRRRAGNGRKARGRASFPTLRKMNVMVISMKNEKILKAIQEGPKDEAD